MKRVFLGFLRFWRLLPAFWFFAGRCIRCGCRRYWQFREHNVCADCLHAYEVGIGESIERYNRHPHLPHYHRSDVEHQIRVAKNGWPAAPVLRGRR